MAADSGSDRHRTRDLARATSVFIPWGQKQNARDTACDCVLYTEKRKNPRQLICGLPQDVVWCVHLCDCQ
jgi:hypothetical protein